MEVFEQLRKEVLAIAAGPMDAKASRAVSMKLLSMHLFQQLLEATEDVKEWGPVAKLILREEREELKQDGQQIRRETLEFAREKFEFDMVDSALKALPQLLALAEAKKDARGFGENEHRNHARREMFRAEVQVRAEGGRENKDGLDSERREAA